VTRTADYLDIGTADPFPRGVYGVRIGKTGKVLDPNGITVSDSPNDIEQAPKVSRGDGSNFGFVYYDRLDPQVAPI
jgi:hypothetical protein